MKAELHVHSAPAVGNTIFKLALVGSILLSFGYVIVKIFASALALLP